MMIGQDIMPRPMPSLLFPSVIISILLSFSIYIALKVIKVRDPKFISVLYLVPMCAPLIIYALFYPPSYILPGRTLDLIPQIKGDFIFGNILFRNSLLKVLGIQYLFIADMFCLAGLSFGAILLAFLYFFGSKIVCRLQGVVELTPQEYPDLISITNRLAERAGISMPRLGITEDLRPNAFTIGWGRRTMIVVTLGLLKVLDGIELEAVMAHEMAHIRNQDFHFLALISSLKAISFYNPLVYILSPAIRKERELLADNTGTQLLGSSDAFGLALTKIWDATKTLPRSFLKQWISGLFIVSEIRHARNFLATHPTLENRLSNISESRIRTSASKRDILKTILICGAVISIVLCTFGLIVQTCFPAMKMNSFGPERIWYRSIDASANHITFKLRLNPPSMINPHGFPPTMILHLDYPWVLNTIDMLLISVILVKIWGPLANLHRHPVGTQLFDVQRAI
jgi:Zn-dependent protease with chaperone function